MSNAPLSPEGAEKLLRWMEQMEVLRTRTNAQLVEMLTAIWARLPLTGVESDLLMEVCERLLPTPEEES
jgi:hypothetical protein